jgi:hypothetical protein
MKDKRFFGRIQNRVAESGKLQGLIALVVFVAIIVASNLQLIIHLSTHVIGRPIEDAFAVLWQLSWGQQALFRQGILPTYSPDVFYPHGWYLASGPEPVWWTIALSFPAYVLGSVATYNLALLATFVVGAWGAFLLARHLTGNWLVGIAAGCIYSMAPVLTLRLGGHLNILLSAQWLPYFALYCHKSLELLGNRRQCAWLLAAGFGALAVLGHWQFVFMVPLIPVSIIGFTRTSVHWQQRLRLLIRIALLTGMFIAPFALHAAYARSQMFQTPPHFPLSTHDAASMSVDRLLVPNPMHPIWGTWSRQTFPLRGESDVISTGYVALLLAVLGLWHGSTFRRPYLILTGLAIVLAMGIALHWNAQRVELTLPEPAATAMRTVESSLVGFDMMPVADKVFIPMPLLFLIKAIPMLGEARAWARFMIVGMLGIATLGALGVNFVLARWSKIGRWLVAAGITAVVVEGATMPYKDFTLVASNAREVDAWLAAQPYRVTLIEYPSPTSGKIALYRQSLHGQRIVNGYTAILPTFLAQVSNMLGKWPTESTILLLREWKVDYIVVTEDTSDLFRNEILPSIQSLSGLCPTKEFTESASGRPTYIFRILQDGQVCESS